LPDWSDLGNKQVKILIDAGNHGLFMDSLLLSNVLTSVGERGSRESSPGEFRLFQNYPNPFNPTTVIRGEGTGDRRMRLIVYDILGREVAVLADGRFPAGQFSFTFDAKNLAGGVYFYRLTAGSFVKTKKMILVK
ncbi:MAG: T9SS type A sorting domain-containing protein, partial [Bacteroidota bacterium]